jgi:hypothetical protein
MNYDIPHNSSNNTDKDYQCSANYRLNGEIVTSIDNSNISDCKLACINNQNCLGFDFNNSTNTCNIYKTITSLNINDNDANFCIKKSINFNNKNEIYNNNLINNKNNNDNNIYSMNNFNSETLMNNMSMNGNNMPMNNLQLSILELSKQNATLQNIINEKTIEAEKKEQKVNEQLMNFAKNEVLIKKQLDTTNDLKDAIQKQLKQKCVNPNIYVDLTCFLDKIDTLKQHSNNMMVSLPVLTSNIKSCSYINKDSSDVSQITVDKMGNPVQNYIDLVNIDSSLSVENDDKNITIPASAIVTTNSKNMNDNNKVISIKEQFDNTEIEQNKFNFKWVSYDLFIVIVLILILVLIIFRK